MKDNTGREAASPFGSDTPDGAAFSEAMAEVLFSRWKPIVLIWFAALIAWTVIAFLTPKVYTSQATFQISVDNVSSLGLPEGLKMLDPRFHSSGGTGVQLAILDSRQLAMTMISAFNLKKKYKTRWDHLAVKRFHKDLEYEVLDEGIVQISFSYSSPDSSKIILDSVLGYLNQESIKYSISKAKLEFDFNRNLTDQVYGHLDSLGNYWVAFMEKHQMVDVKENVELSLKSYGVIEQSLLALEGQYELAKIDNTIPPQERANLQVQIQLLKNKKRSILKGQTEEGGDGSRLSINYDSIPSMLAFEEKINLLTEKDKTVLKALIPKLEQSRIKMIETTPVLNVIDSAFIPPYKSGPKRVVIISIGTIVTGIFLSLLFMVIVFFRDPKIELKGLPKFLRHGKNLH